MKQTEILRMPFSTDKEIAYVEFLINSCGWRLIGTILNFATLERKTK